MNVLVVDDEPLARQLLRRLLADVPDATRVHDVGSGAEAVDELAKGVWDVAFLDVQMPGMDGFAVLAKLTAPPVVVFVTAHEQHAVDAFGVEAADYLLKPVARARFEVAVERARNRVRQRDLQRRGDELIAAIRGLQGRQSVPELRLEDGAGLHIVDVRSLRRVEADDKHVVLVGERRTWRIRRPFAEVVGLLDPDEFVQIHRSCMVARARVTGLDHSMGGVPFAILDDGSRVRVSKARLAAVRERLLR